ncbi:MAG TPA: 2-amino-4-hydroxy-6-hydroxymethyldihydropteridine diphosphokinase [Candidatus Omnitrophota bacterium]|nr:2-amino-4-hydroxy-6-hydroxymethyldihydropteridine diphosphokinase [Candidatus Omnitrophota bacterium]HPD85356.1 2-amino-4-hydroxy-6-hydroxymethyldihydropteridine diphosphokinase [Candidatus Omnitrophota bacterium]HRZ04143.1 2-amino-4-hydroxy-6-hydroxymethyldihydropteridine diphosphokinase [Candidatus Omnitrophota bacterium]
MNTAVIGLGSNIRPQENIQKAKEILSRTHTILAESQFIKTKPIGSVPQDDFLNGAYLLETALDYEDFKAYLKKVEEKLGRKKCADKFGPRTIDLDILAWNNKVTHEDFFKRNFVKTTVLELLPNIKF